jgi:hypothetical protein
MIYIVEMPSCGMIFVPSKIKISTGVHALLRSCLSNLNGCNVGIIAVKKL